MKAIHRRGQIYDRASVADMINPDNGVRGKMKRLGQTPKDHMKENRMELRQIQLRNRELKDYEGQDEKELYKLPQFREIEPRLYEISDDPNIQKVDNFLTKNSSKKRFENLKLENRAHREELEAKMEDDKQFSSLSHDNTPRRELVPKEKAKLAPRKSVDFVSQNRVKARMMAPPSAAREAEGNGPERHAAFGRVPEYLEARKAQWQEEEEELRRRAPDPSCPPGMCLMPEEERVSTLKVLHASKEEILRQLRNMPFVVETPSQIKRKNDMDLKLQEIEKALALFSRPKVYVALDH